MRDTAGSSSLRSVASWRSMRWRCLRDRSATAASARRAGGNTPPSRSASSCGRRRDRLRAPQRPALRQSMTAGVFGQADAGPNGPRAMGVQSDIGRLSAGPPWSRHRTLRGCRRSCPSRRKRERLEREADADQPCREQHQQRGRRGRCGCKCARAVAGRRSLAVTGALRNPADARRRPTAARPRWG